MEKNGKVVLFLLYIKNSDRMYAWTPTGKLISSETGIAM